jgi:hypothetical protein
MKEQQQNEVEINNKNEKQTSFPSKIGKELTEFFLVTTSHGFKHIPLSKLMIIKILWTILTGLGVGGCIYFNIMNFIVYYQYKVTTSIDIVDEIPSNFPMITICNQQQFVTEAGVSFVNKVLEKYNITFPERNPDTEDQFTFYGYLVMQNVLNPLITDEEKRSFGLSHDELILYCRIKGIKCNNDDLNWIYLPFHGNCFQINTNGSIKMYSKKEFLGVDLQILVASYSESLHKTKGIQLFITNQHESLLTAIGY